MYICLSCLREGGGTPDLPEVRLLAQCCRAWMKLGPVEGPNKGDSGGEKLP